MKIQIEWFGGAYPQFNVSVASAEGKEPFVVLKGCRIANGTKGPFVSWPSTKNEKTGKYWQHVWASEPFAAAVLAEAQATQPKERDKAESLKAPRRSAEDDDSRIPF